MINGTKLSPLEEQLFRGWAMANGVQNHDDPNNQFDHRGLYKSSNGSILPPGVLNNLAAAHNKSMEPQEGGDTTFPDPYMAQAEMHGNELKARGDQAKLDHAFKLEDVKHQHKLELEQMKLQHKSQQAEVDRQHAQAQAEQDRQMQQQQSQQDRQNQMQDVMMQRQHSVEDQHMQRQNQVEDTQRAEQSGLRDTLVKGHLDQQKQSMQPSPQTTMNAPSGPEHPGSQTINPQQAAQPKPPMDDLQGALMNRGDF